jgi:hypothetical protein
MSLGTQPKALDAAGAKQADQPQPVQPKWDVNHREVLNQIKHDRAGAHPDARAVAAAAQPHRDVQQQQQQQQIHQRVDRPAPHPVGNRPEVHRPEVQRQVQQQQLQQQQEQRRHPDVRHHGQTQPHRTDITQPQQIAQNHPTQQWNRRDSHNQNQHPTEINRTIINNNQRYEYGNNGGQNNNNLKYLYGGLAGGALLGGGATYYANRDNYRDYAYGQNYNGSVYSDPYRNFNNGSTYNQYNRYNQYNQYDQYALNNQYNQYDQYALNNGYDQYGQYNNSWQYGNNNSDYLYGGTTYGGAGFDRYGNPPIYETTYVDRYRPVYRDQNPLNVIPQIFGTILGGVLGNITNSNHHRRYYNPADC